MQKPLKDYLALTPAQILAEPDAQLGSALRSYSERKERRCEGDERV